MASLINNLIEQMLEKIDSGNTTIREYGDVYVDEDTKLVVVSKEDVDGILDTMEWVRTALKSFPNGNIDESK